MISSIKDCPLVIDLHYFASINYYRALIEYDILKFEQYEHYQKGSCRNRCYIAGPDGLILLSVPLARGKNQRIILKDVRIANEGKWQAIHWKTLTSAYRRSPWFEYHEEDLQQLYERRYTFLLDWNLDLFELVRHWLGLSWQVELTGEYQQTYDPESCADLRNIFLPAIREPTIPPYTQVFGDRTGFLPGLSILDLIFCEGRSAAERLRGPAELPKKIQQP